MTSFPLLLLQGRQDFGQIRYLFSIDSVDAIGHLCTRASHVMYRPNHGCDWKAFNKSLKLHKEYAIVMLWWDEGTVVVGFETLDKKLIF